MDYNPTNVPGSNMPPGGGPVQPPQKPKGRKGRNSGSGSEPMVTKKVVDRQRTFAIVMAIVLALIALVVVFGDQKPETYVVRAVEPIPAGTLVNVDTQLEAFPIDDAFVEEGSITGNSEESALEQAKEDLEGLRAQYPLAAQQQVHQEYFNVEIILNEPLQPNERLMSIPATISAAVAGQIKVGDRVDIHSAKGEVGNFIAQNIEVVAVTVSENQYESLASRQTGEDRNVKESELLPGDPIPGIYTIRVSAELAPILAAAAIDSRLSLIYRGKEAVDLNNAPLTALDAICGEVTEGACAR